MRTAVISALLAVSGYHVSAATIPPTPTASLAPPVPISKYPPPIVKPATLDEILANVNTTKPALPAPSEVGFRIMAVTCNGVRTRREWDSYSNDDRQAFVNAVKCLQGRPASGQFQQARTRYEDLVALHQTLTPNVHNNHKFLLWHRYYLWVFEDLLRSECGFDRDLPWFDETRYAGRFSQSSVFSDQWFGAIGLNGDCVRNGQFANLNLNVGPGTDNYAHCLARAGDSGKTANTNQEVVDGCNRNGGYAAMAKCAEEGAHAWGHNGIGATMQDPYASPADPIFWLHHAFIDRNFRIWQNADASRTQYVDGTDRAGNPLTLDTNINVYGIRPDIRVRDILDTVSGLCYKYNY